MDSSSSSSMNKTNTKLSVRKQTRFKKPSSLSVTPSKKMTNLCMREQTVLKKAEELSTLCEIQACVIYYDRYGNLVNTWPEDQSKVRDMAERFSRLSDKEKRKKSTNLSQFLNKKMNDEMKKRSLDDQNDDKFSHKVSELECSLVNRLQLLQDRLHRLQTEPADQSHPEQNQNFTVSSGFFSTDLSYSPLINDQLVKLSPPSLIHDPHQQSRFSIFLYDHENATFTQLPDSASRFDQALTPFNNDLSLLGAQGLVGDGISLRSCSNNMVPTQDPLLQFGQYASWNQTPATSFGDPMMMFSSYN